MARNTHIMKKCDIFYPSSLIEDTKERSDKLLKELGFRLFDLTCPMCNLRLDMSLLMPARRHATSFVRRKTLLSRKDRKPVISLKNKK